MPETTDRKIEWYERPLILVTWVALVYAGWGGISYLLRFREYDICAIWPAAGLALFAALRFGRWSYLGIYLGSAIVNFLIFLADLPMERRLILSALTGLGPVLEAFLGYWFVERWLTRAHLLERFRTQMAYVLLMPFVCAMSAVFGIGTAYSLGAVPDDRVWKSFTLWAMGDYTGVLTMTPLLLIWTARQRYERNRIYNYLIFFILLLFVPVVTTDRLPLPIFVLVPLLFSSFYLPQRFTLSGLLLIVVWLTLATTDGQGPLYNEGNFKFTTFSLYGYIIVLSTAALTVSAGVQNRIRKDFFDTATLGIGVSAHGQKRFIDANPALADMLGYRDVDHMLETITDVGTQLYVNPEDRKELLKRVKKEADPKAYRFEALKADGSKLWLELTARKVNWNGELILGFAKDITRTLPQKRLSRLALFLASKLREPRRPAEWLSETLPVFGRVLECERISIYLYDADFKHGERFTWTPDGYHEPSRYRLAESDRIGQMEHYEKIPNVDSLWIVTLEFGGKEIGHAVLRGLNWLYNLPLREQKQLSVEETNPDFPPFSGRDYIESLLRAMGQTVLRYRQIEDEKTAREALKTTNDSLKSTNEKLDSARRESEKTHGELEEAHRELKAIHDLALVGIFSADARGETIAMNPAGREIDGIREGDDLKKWPEKLSPECRKRVGGEWSDYVTLCRTTAHAEPKVMEQELIVDDKRKLVLMQAQPIRNSAERLTGFVGVLTDITAIHHENTLLRQCTELYGHNTKNPLAAIRAEITILHKETRPSKRDEHIGQIRQSLDSIEYLARHARIVRSPGQVVRDRKDFNLHRLLKWLAKLKFSLGNDSANPKFAGADNPHTKVDYDGLVKSLKGVPRWVNGPEDVVAHVLMNLIYNAAAIESCDTIRLSLTAEDHAVTFAVEDNGPGITPQKRFEELQAELAESLPDLKKKINLPETPRNGRGLPLCQIVLRELGSELRAEVSSEGKNNRFAFTIQFQPATTVDPEGSSATVSFRGLGGVLLVEDDPSVSAGIAHMLLAGEADSVNICTKGEEAVADFERDPDRYSLALVDVQLAESRLDGYKVCKAIKKVRGDFRVICISATENVSASREEAGFDGFAAKGDWDSPAELLAMWTGVSVALLERPALPGLAGWSRRAGTISAAMAIIALLYDPIHSHSFEGEWEQYRCDPKKTRFHEAMGKCSHLRLPEIAQAIHDGLTVPDGELAQARLKQLLEDLRRDADDCYTQRPG